MFREEVILLQAIQLLPASTDRIHTEVLKAILYLQVAVWKDPVHLHTEALLLQVAAGHTAAAGNQEVLIQDLHPVEVVLHPVEVDLLHQVAEVDHHPAGVSL